MLYLPLAIILLAAVNQPTTPGGLPDKGEGWWPDTFYHLHRFAVEVNGVPALEGVPRPAETAREEGGLARITRPFRFRPCD